MERWIEESRVQNARDFWHGCKRGGRGGVVYESVSEGVYYLVPEFASWLPVQIAAGTTLQDFGTDETEFVQVMTNMAALVNRYFKYWEKNQDWYTGRVEDGYRAFFKLCEKHCVGVSVTEEDVQRCEAAQRRWQHGQDAQEWRTSLLRAMRAVRLCKRFASNDFESVRAKRHSETVMEGLRAEDIVFPGAELEEMISVGEDALGLTREKFVELLATILFQDLNSEVFWQLAPRVWKIWI